MKESRRKFLKIAGISAIGIGTGSVLNAFASSAPKVEKAAADAAPEAEDSKFKKRPESLKAGHWGMVIDTRKIDEAMAAKIQEVCHRIHNVPSFEGRPDLKKQELKWIWTSDYKHVFPMQANPYVSEKLKKAPILALCNHCENPPCVRACPTKATFQREDGIIMMDFHRCIGCRFCMAACPYGARSFNFRDPKPYIAELDLMYPHRMKGVVEKCNFCDERLARGQMPACVEVSKGAIVFGDLEDPNSDVRKALKANTTIRRKPSLGTGPSVYYIV
ncbi:sulfate reduction electron transfer complex DsrMKJOP subunit DsrO [Desulfobotulus sp.]|jgi:molybdopterin-containing oxidoreductase family iron-sulfur binding subunit|uniref:sulfate reduction electron transfer complex DsrMKJOP subunit DsrO n=1 Tax=Desulfobotulus sp. TaxID=1940337 RepID=UPI002A35A873|nr:4Fe-4S dicluster domain-containing protein [Desulfobotulus sp.]MDY0163792.1 4Fe-4S dicluster domain-containing protein [Desulfobotulus sp.]